MEQLSIGAVARMTGVSEFTLRAWERRYTGLKPSRLANGRRVYTLDDVEKLSLMGQLTSGGHAIGDIIHLDAARLAALVQRLKGSAADEEGPTSGMGLARVHVDAMLTAIDKLDVVGLGVLLKTMHMQFNTRSFLLDIVALMLRDMGERVSSGRLDVFHEHAASAVLRNFLTGILFSTEQSAAFSDRPPIVFAAPEGDHHEFGILIAALLASMRSHQVFYLGPNMPFGSLERAARLTKSPLIVLGVSAPEEALSKNEINDYVRNLSRRAQESCRIWVGGSRAAELSLGASSARIKKITTLNAFDRALALEQQD